MHMPLLQACRRQFDRLKAKPLAIDSQTRHGSRSFRRDESGAIAIMFALAMIPIILMIGVGIDYTRVALDRSQTQDAIDAAALAAVKKVAVLNDAEVRAMIESYMAANIPNGVNVKIDLVEIERNPNAVKVWASGETETTFLRIANITSSDFKANSRAVAADQTLEVVMVLDNSGSMASSMNSLKEGATELVNILETASATRTDLSIGIVPFNHLVRLDKASQDADWVDKNAKSSVHRNNLPPKANRLELFNTLTNPYTHHPEEWAGCVEARPHPYDIEDTSANSAYNDSYFVPFFYPDSKEENNEHKNNSNTYLPYYYGYYWLPSNTKKKFGHYYQRTFNSGYYGYGPNYFCNVPRLMPLNTNLDSVRDHIKTMRADGATNIHMGTIWGVRVLSPQAPYTGGRSYDDHENVKFLIIMTDGANTYYDTYYLAYGWQADGRINGSGSVVKEMNKRTLESCKAAWDAGVQIFTIAYGDPGKETQDMMKECAKNLDSNYFAPTRQSELIETFKDIAATLNTIRLTQ